MTTLYWATGQKYDIVSAIFHHLRLNHSLKDCFRLNVGLFRFLKARDRKIVVKGFLIDFLNIINMRNNHCKVFCSLAFKAFCLNKSKREGIAESYYPFLLGIQIAQALDYKI